MRLLQDFLDRSKQLNQTPRRPEALAYHPPNKNYKIVHQALILPNLPAPLRYINFFSMIGQPNIPVWANLSAIHSTALDTVTVQCSTSAHMLGQLNRYSVQQDCRFSENSFQFGQREWMEGAFPNFHLQRQDAELSFDLNIQTTELISHLKHLRCNLLEHWSLLCHCEGQIRYKSQHYSIQALGSFEYARSVNLPYVSVAFFTRQIINLNQDVQIIVLQSRDHFNRVIQSRLYLRNLAKMENTLFDENVFFKVHRVYPSVSTPNGQKMYLPREFEWLYRDQHGSCISIQAQSRGDFKFGLAAGYVGSFSYHIRWNDELIDGEGGYMEYIDCRPLRHQEQDQDAKNMNYFTKNVPFMIKKKKKSDFL